MSIVRAAERQSFRLGSRSAKWGRRRFAEPCCCRSPCRLVGPPNSGSSSKGGECSTELYGMSRSRTGAGNRRNRIFRMHGQMGDFASGWLFSHVRKTRARTCSWIRGQRLSAASASGLGGTPEGQQIGPHFAVPIVRPWSQAWDVAPVRSVYHPRIW